MANRLFDAPDLISVIPGDGMWSAQPVDLTASRAATTMLVQDPCSETGQFVAGSASGTGPNVYNIQAFSTTVSARRNVRCDEGFGLTLVLDLLENGGTTSAAEYVLWNGISAWNTALNPSLQNTDVTVVSKGATVADSIAAVIDEYSALTVYSEYVIHLGVQSALDLSAQGYTETIDQQGQLRVKATGAPIVTSPYYPATGVGLTGPIEVRVGDPTAYQAWDYKLNRTNIVGYQLISLFFDPSTSVRAQ